MRDAHEPLDPQLQANLEPLRETPPRNPTAAARGRAKFLSQAVTPGANPTLHAKRQPEQCSGRKGFPWMLPARLGYQLIALTLVFAILFAGSGAASVYAARESLPGEFLYPVKTWGEDVLLTLSSNPQTRLNLNLRFADRRMIEIAEILDGDEVLAAQTMLRLQNHLDKALETTGKITQEQALPAMEHVRQTLQYQQMLMSQLQHQANPAHEPLMNQASEMLQQHMRILEDQLEEEQFQQQNRPGQTDWEGPQGRPGQQGAGSQDRDDEQLQENQLQLTQTPTPTVVPGGMQMGPDARNNQMRLQPSPMPQR